MKIGYFLGIIGCWLLCDGWISLNLYWRNKEQTFWRDHIIRVIRMAIGVSLMITGYYL